MNTQKATVLVVDDNPINLDILFKSLSQAGFKVLIAKDGENAIRQAELARPDAILLDIVMPGLDGFETCRRLKNKTQTKDIPVIFLSALADTPDKVKGFKIGAVDYITKPFQQEEVLARITTHITLRNLRRLVETHNEELQEALTKVKLLSGLLPICANCKKIRDNEDYWQDVAVYIRDHSEADFSHGICPDCAKELYPEFYKGDG